MPTAEQLARTNIEKLLITARWAVDDASATSIHVSHDGAMLDFLGRDWMAKILLFGKDDAHAENVVAIVREELGKSSNFVQEIIGCATGAKPRDLVTALRTNPMPRIAGTVDMIAACTDIKPLEIEMFIGAVKSRTFVAQVKGCGLWTINLAAGPACQDRINAKCQH